MSTSIEFYKHYPNLTWDWNPSQIAENTQKIIDRARGLVDDLLLIPDDKLSFAVAVEPMALDDGEFELVQNIIGLLFSVSNDKTVRDAATMANKTIADFLIEMEMKIGVYQMFTKVRACETCLDEESDRFLNKCLLYKRRSGLHLPKETRDQLEGIHKKITNLAIDFEQNLSEENTILTFTLQDLKGMPPDFMAALEKSGDDFKVTLKYPHVIPIMKNCQVVSTRSQVEKAFQSRCIDKNVSILEEMIVLRHQKAEILGYATHADFITEILMSKSAKNVEQFLTSLADKLKPAFMKEIDRLSELKKLECHKLGSHFDGKVNSFDISYYQRMVEETDFNVDQNVLKEYFPFEFVTTKLLQMYQTLLSLKFVQVHDTKVWHPEVTLYAVYCEVNKQLLGHFYLDLFPREGKYTHAACFGIQSGTNTKNGYRITCSAMVANFTKPLPDKPSLLTHTEVETYFHEFGHVMHQICSRTRYTLFHGTAVERDFVEAPSQMLQNWVWEKESLKQISCHYKTKEPLSDDLIEKLCKSRKANVSQHYMRQITLAMFDHIIHTTPHSNTYEVLQKCYQKYLGYSPQVNTNFAASFGHMAGGYDAQYYGYLWSEVFSSDMFVSRFKKEGIFNPKTGMDYRTLILQPGNTKDATDMLRAFLGRDPIHEPFLQMAGIIPE